MSNLKILIVEDSLTDAELLVTELENARFRFSFHRVEKKDDYLKYLSENTPDVIISDYNLPSFGALEALKIRNSRYKHLPFILVTGNTTEEIAVDCIKQGADDYILKSSLVRLPTAVINAIEKKKAEAEILKANERTRFLIESIPQKIFTTDDKGFANYFNPLWVEYTGIPYENLIKGDWSTIFHPEDYSHSMNIWESSKKTGESLTLEHRLRNKNNEYRWHLTRAVPQKDEKGNILMWMGTNTDIHDLKMAQQDLDNSRRALEEKNRELLHNNNQLVKTNNDLDNFVYTASHDLKAPISNLEGLIGALEEVINSGLDIPENKEESCLILQMIKDSLGRFRNTINDLTEISKIQKQGINPSEIINLSELIEDVCFTVNEQINSTNALIRKEIDSCPSISFSRKDLKSILYNIISNAIKYRSPERRPEITISSEELPDYCVINIKDNGLGFSQDNINKAFSMFKRFHSHVEGSGIGLYIVKRIMDNNGGYIQLISQEGQGSEFKLHFRKFQPEEVSTISETSDLL
ncbi:MAG: ATP-binding protein [Cytophagaceae bacterium]